MRRDIREDGLIHDYQTCPKCREIVSTEDMVLLDGRKMCRGCLRLLQGKHKHGDSPYDLSVGKKGFRAIRQQ